MKSALLALALAVALMAALPATAQTCVGTESFSDCLNKIIPALTGEASTPEAEEAKTDDATETAVTGISSTVSPAESSLKDFLSLLSASLESATTSQDGQTFTFDWNPSVAFTEAIGFKMQAAFPETKLNDEVTAQLSGNAAKVEQLSDSLEFGDDATLSAFVQPRTTGLGRSIESHRLWFRPMRDAVLATRVQELADEEALIDQFDLVSEKQLLQNDASGQPLPAAEVTARINAITAYANRVKANRVVRDRFFLAFAKLLNNQPQFYGAAQYHARRNLIGPNEWSGKLTYEFAANNLNAFLRSNKTCREISAANAVSCADALTSFANATRPGIERLAVSLEYHRVNRRWIDDPDAGLAFGYPRSRSFIGTLALGTTMTPMLPFRAETTGVGDARLDFTAKYEMPKDSGDDDSANEGFVGTLTYTQKVSETFSLPLSLVYSDHESDLLNVQKKFSARFGLMYKLPDFN